MMNKNLLPQQLSDQELKSLTDLLIALAQSEECNDECGCNKTEQTSSKPSFLFAQIVKR